ncbi:molecular chaperone TorD family protein [Anaerobacillus sp. HL2]|nr:molecular chaperone TorD family protein [Anaerobacillus sp. HL2]
MRCLKNCEDLPDHITVELEFIYFLYFSYRESGEYKHIENIKVFMKNHLSKWAQPFMSKIEEKSNRKNFISYLLQSS